MNRPMMWVAGSFALGIAMIHALWIEDWSLAAPIALLIVAWVFAAARVRGGSIAFAVVMLAFVAGGGARYTSARYRIEHDPLHVFLNAHRAQTLTITGKALATPLLTAPDRTPQVVVVVDSVTVGKNGHNVSGTVLVRSKDAQGVMPGDRVKTTGIVSPPTSFSLHTDPYTQYLGRQGIAAVIDPVGPDGFVSLFATEPPGMRRAIFEVRRHILDILSRGLGDRGKLFIAAVWLGEKRALPNTTGETLINTGTYHVACVSGVHLAIMAAVASFTLQSLGFSNKKGSIATIAAVIIFTVMTGMRLPVCRAAFMLITYYTAQLVRRKGDTLNSISLAAFVLLIIQPINLLDAGFQLSFLAVFTLAIMRRRGLHRTSVPGSFAEKSIRSAFLMSLAIFFASLPIVMHTFKTVSFISPAANLFATPMMVPILALAATSTGIGFLWPPAAILFNGANRLLIDFLLLVLDNIEKVPGAYMKVAPPPPHTIMLYYIGLAILLTSRALTLAPKKTVIEPYETGTMPMRRRGPLAAIAFSTAILVWIAPGTKQQLSVHDNTDLNNPTLTMTTINVGQGDAILLEFPSGQTLLVDAGPAWPNGDAGQSRVVPFLQNNGIEYLNGVLLTHAHMDHVGGMASVLDAIPAGTVFSTGVSWDIPAYNRFLDAVDRHEIPHEFLRAGDRLEFGDGVTIEIIYPTDEDIEIYAGDPNNLSIIFMISYGKTDILMTGDATEFVEMLLIERGVDLQADVLKVPHNGSARASTPEFLKKVAPTIAALPVGAKNSFGFPSPELLGRYQKAGIKMFRTDRHGHIRIETDGTLIRWETTTQNKGAAQAR